MLMLNYRLWKAVLLAVVVLPFCGVTLLAAVICGACGYENSDTARFCSHCGEKLVVHAGSGKKARKQARRTVAASEDASVSDNRGSGVAKKAEGSGLISMDELRREMLLADQYASQHKYDLAVLFARNALAFNILAGDDSENARYKAIMTHLQRYQDAAATARNRCPDCNGSGVAVLQAHSMSTSAFGVKTAGMRCKRCGGTGFIRGGLTINERKHSIGIAVEEYRTIQQSRKMVPLGQVWVPENISEELDVRSRVALKRAVAPVCSDCLGLGRTECKECHGRGVVRCRAKGCVDGYVEDRDTRERRRIGSGRMRISNKTSGRHKCSVCHGTGLVQCEKCSGKGSFICKHCNGSGHAPLCGKCDGTGIVKCRRCRGTGQYRGKTCPYCHGEGIAECSSCGGTGRRK